MRPALPFPSDLELLLRLCVPETSSASRSEDSRWGGEHRDVPEALTSAGEAQPRASWPQGGTGTGKRTR